MTRTRERKIPLAPLREAFLESGRTASEVARSLGWTRTSYSRNQGGHRRGPYRVADSERVRRTLGIIPENQGHGYPPKLRERCSYEMAVRLALAIGIDPFEVDL